MMISYLCLTLTKRPHIPFHRADHLGIQLHAGAKERFRKNQKNFLPIKFVSAVSALIGFQP